MANRAYQHFTTFADASDWNLLFCIGDWTLWLLGTGLMALILAAVGAYKSRRVG
jgi:hypothetical protein